MPLDTATEDLTPEQLEAELQARLDQTDAKLRGDDEPAGEKPEPSEEPAPDKLIVEDDDKPEGAAEPAKPEAEPEPKPEPAPEKPAAVLSDDDEKAIAELPEAAQGAFRARLEKAAAERTELEEKNRKLAQDNRSMSGRVSAYQRRYEEATGKRPPAEKPAAVTPEQTEAWTNFQDEYPEIAKAIEARFAASLPEGTAAKTQELLQYVEDQKRDAFLKDAWAAVESVHPNWRAEGSTRAFADWKQSSPTYEKLAASDDIADAIALFDLYEAHKARTQGHADPEPAPAPAAKASTAAADQVAARREKQAEGAIAPSGKAATPNHSVDLNDADQLFNFYAKNADARLKRR